MTSNNDYFTPEQIDEQIEQLHQTMLPPGESTNEKHLVDALQRYHQVHLSAEDRASLERARKRIINNQSNEMALDEGTQLATVPPSIPAAHPRRKRFARILSGLAAVIIIGVLLGSWLVVTNRVSTPPMVSLQGPSDLYVVHSGVAYRLDGSTGKVIWQDPLSTNQQFANAYVQIVNGVAYVVFGFDVYALDARNGAQIWHVTNPSSKGYFWSVVNNGRIYLFSLDYTFSALDAANGSELWHNTTFTTTNGYGFSVLDGNLYTQGSGSDQGGQLYTLDGANGNVRWHMFLQQASLLGAPVIENRVVYFSAGSFLYALNEQSGTKIWEQATMAEGASIAYIADGILYASGPTMMTQNGSTGTAGPAPDSGNIFAFNAQTGKPLWTSDPGYQTLTAPLPNGPLLAERIHKGASSIVGLDPQTGKVNWQVPLQCPIGQSSQQPNPVCSPLWTEIINGKLYLLEASGQTQSKTVLSLKSLNPDTGQQHSAQQLTIAQSNPAVIGTRNGLLYLQLSIPKTANSIPYADYLFAALRLSDGSLAWNHAMPPFPPPTSADTSPNTSTPILAP